MRRREEILKQYQNVSGGPMMKDADQANVLNPKLQLEVLLDMREILLEMKGKIKC